MVILSQLLKHNLSQVKLWSIPKDVLRINFFPILKLFFKKDRGFMLKACLYIYAVRNIFLFTMFLPSFRFKGRQ